MPHAGAGWGKQGRREETDGRTNHIRHSPAAVDQRHSSLLRHEDDVTNAAAIAGYCGKSQVPDEALAAEAEAYADQTIVPVG